MSDNELGAFLRTRREAVTPAEVGLPNGTRRRTPGLRRAELATLAGISVDYLTRIELGPHRRRASRPPQDRIRRADPHIAELAEELTITAGAAFTDRWQVPPTVPVSK